MNIKRLFLEITRRCQSPCRRCLRGKAQDLDMAEEVMEMIVQDVDYIDELILTGGEPLLVPELISDLAGLLKRSGTTVGHFRIATGLAGVNVEHAVIALDALSNATEEPLLNVVLLSQNSGQPEPDSDALKLMKSRSYFRSDWHGFGDRQLAGSKEVACGHGYSENAANPFYLNGFEVEFGGNRIVSDVYISVLGNVLTSCDLSYHLIDDHRIHCGNCCDQRLQEIVLNKALPVQAIRRIEVPIQGEIGFSQYWNGLKEEQRGDWFGYVMHCLYGRDLPGYGIFWLLEHHEEARSVQALEDFASLLKRKCLSPPSWASLEEIDQWKSLVKIELTNHLRLMQQMIYVIDPFYQLLDLYISDCPYSAEARLVQLLRRKFQTVNTKVN